MQCNILARKEFPGLIPKKMGYYMSREKGSLEEREN